MGGAQVGLIRITGCGSGCKRLFQGVRDLDRKLLIYITQSDQRVRDLDRKSLIYIMARIKISDPLKPLETEIKISDPLKRKRTPSPDTVNCRGRRTPDIPVPYCSPAHAQAYHLPQLLCASHTWSC